MISHSRAKFQKIGYCLANMAPKTERRELEQSTRNNIIGMSTAGLSGRKIANQLGLVPSTVNKVIKRYKDTNSTENGTRPGRPKKTYGKGH